MPPRTECVHGVQDGPSAEELKASFQSFMKESMGRGDGDGATPTNVQCPCEWTRCEGFGGMSLVGE